MNDFRPTIISTLAYFDIFDYPLTAWEIWKYLYRQKSTLKEVLDELEGLCNENILENKNGHYFFPGKEYSYRQRMERYTIAEKKFKIALHVARVLSYVPGVLMISVCNSLAMSNARDDSDIDFFIITEKKRLWFVRFFCVIITQLLGVRRHHNYEKDRVCLSFFLADANMSLESIAIDEDIYLWYWISNITPIYICGNIFEKFLSTNNWTREHLPNIFFKIPNERRAIRERKNFILGRFGDALEAFSKKLQLQHLQNLAQNSKSHDSSSVVLSDQMLKLHFIDRRKEFREGWIKRLNEVIGR